jgi:hypothetical protein
MLENDKDCILTDNFENSWRGVNLIKFVILLKVIDLKYDL